MTGEEMRRLMWGRASISSPVKITKKKLKDPYNLHQESDFTNAMDMLQFANDPATGVGGIPLTTAPKTATAEKSPPAPDPLRELIILSDRQPSVHDPQFFAGLQQLANKAFALVEQTLKTQPIKISALANGTVPTATTVAMTTTTTTSITSTLSTAVTPTLAAVGTPVLIPIDPAAAIPLAPSLTNLFQDPKEIVDPKKLDAFLKMLAEVETEESDGGGPILGKLSLARRTRTALSKAPIRKEIVGEAGEDPFITSVWQHQIPETPAEPVSN